MSMWTEQWGNVKVRLLSAGRRAPRSRTERSRQFAAADSATEREYIEARQQQGTHAPQDDTQRTDKAHTAIGAVALGMLASGAAIEWNAGYSCLIVGGLLLAGVIYARTRTDTGVPPGYGG